MFGFGTKAQILELERKVASLEHQLKTVDEAVDRTFKYSWDTNISTIHLFQRMNGIPESKLESYEEMRQRLRDETFAKDFKEAYLQFHE